MKTFKEFLAEAAFVSGAPHTGASNGVEYDVKENKEHADGAHKHFDVFHNGEHVGHVKSYSTYEDKKVAGSRVANSRKEVTRWKTHVNPGQHNFIHYTGGKPDSTKAATGSEYKSKKDALQRLADIHKTK